MGGERGNTWTSGCFLKIRDSGSLRPHFFFFHGNRLEESCTCRLFLSISSCPGPHPPWAGLTPRPCGTYYLISPLRVT